MTDAGELIFTEQIGKNNREKKRLVFQLSRICIAQSMGGVEQSGNKFAIIFLFRKMFYQHFGWLEEIIKFKGR